MINLKRIWLPFLLFIFVSIVYLCFCLRCRSGYVEDLGRPARTSPVLQGL
jgi:hypothetical protein